MQSGTFPKKFKISKISPIFKKNDPEELSNYRPIFKILEKIIYKRVTSFRTTNKILSDKQYGFRKNLFCELAVLELTQRTLVNMT